ncbi:hypothetical protein GZ77_03560 [Endozoicomonas montiporae]|uniref:Uncharacterized protein n=2 Tax=Endozoicomonas montiporae TaxID=1027273 RepID=A0A081NB44_9GAMM|nr:hypothetical protein [Endozoicomonas montiporae]AMO56621.1 hypothetical protein EZMO1_2542 [Endozoicomonas montiporae CL-33]KEQ15667.1 hypothetical protein GZ77_03560 [Endozoicomonas montiporae]
MEQALENLDALEQITPDEQEAETLLAEVEQSEQAQQQANAEDVAAQQGAVMAVSMVETLVKMRWSFVQIDDGIRGQVIEKAVPVCKKYGSDFPDWLKPFREEIELGMVVAAAGFGIWSQIKAHEAAQQSPQETEQGAGDEAETGESEYSTP